jgi:Ca-activated chloride channel family protein
VRAFVAKVHENVVQYGQSTGFFADKMAVGGPAYADAVVLYESDVIQANNHIRVRGLGFPTLVAVYPKEGTFVSNHPYAIVQRDWVDADEEEGARKYFEYLTSPAVQARALQYGLRPGVALELDRNLYARVWNADNGTKPFDAVHRFLAVPNGQVVAAAREAFRSIKNDALVYLVVDRSGSMNEQILDPELGRWRPRIDMAVESADQLVRRLQDRDRLALLLYDYTVDDAHLTPDGRPIAMTADGKQRLREALSRIDPKGGTAMRNAIGRAWTSICKDIKRNQRDRAIRIIVVLTDGVDNASAMSTDKLIELTGYAAPNGQGGYHGDPACKIPVFGIAFGDQADAESLRRISEAAGGETREGDSAEIRDIFERFGDLL